MIGHDGSAEVTGGQAVVAMLEALGVRHVFGVPGGQTLAVTDALLDARSIRFVATRHEGAAACMADAVGRITGRPGVCLATTGPGATNLLTGVGGAMRDSSPVLVLTCNNYSHDLGRDDAQAADHVSIFKPLTKWATLVTHPSMIPQALIEAYMRASSGCPGPVLIDLARDAIEQAVAARDVLPSPELGQVIERTLRSRPIGDPSQIAAIADALCSSRAPVIWLGNGARISGAGPVALDLARRIDAAVLTTFNGIGTVPTSDPNVFGPLSRMGTALSTRVMDEADVLLVVGNSLNGPSTGRWTMRLPELIFQIDIEPSQFGRAYGMQTTGVMGDARSVLEQLLSSVPEARHGETAGRRAQRIEALRWEKDHWHQQASAAVGRTGAIDPSYVIGALRDVTDSATLLVVDAGNPGVWTHLWEVREPGTYLKPVGFGNMGFALPGAIAGKLLEPERTVVALIGDGSLGMTLGELETVAREGLAVCIVVLNDLGYGNIRQEQAMKYGSRTIGVDFGEVDYAAVAKAFGLDARRVDDPSQVKDALAVAVASERGFLIDVRIDPELSIWKHPLFKAYDTES